MVEIKSYQPEFLENQVEVGQTVYAQWKYGGQTSKDQLERTYTTETFDPETRLYAFKDGEMVGFLPSSVQPKEDDQPLTARLEIPLVPDADAEIIETLYDHAVIVLRSKGVEKITTRAGSAWGYTLDFVTSKGFEPGNTIVKEGSYDLTNWEISELPLETVEVDMAVHEEQLRDMYHRFYPNVAEQAIENAITQLKEGNSIDFITHLVVLEDDLVVGRLTASTSSDGDRIANLGTLISFADHNQEVVEKTLISAVMNQLRHQGYERVNIALSGPVINSEDKYQELGIAFIPALQFYHLDL